MKTFAIIFAVLFAGITALPQPTEIDALRAAIIQKDARIVAGIIENLINSVKERLVLAGYDPYVVEQLDGYLPITDDIAVSGSISNLRMEGIANIAVNQINYGLLSGNLDLDLALPSVSLSANDVSALLYIYSLDPNTFSLVKVSGNAGIRNLRLVASARISIGIISGVSVNNLRVAVSLGGIDSNLNLQVIGNDYSDLANNIIGNIIPQLLSDYSAQINDLLVQIVEYVISQIL